MRSLLQFKRNSSLSRRGQALRCCPPPALSVATAALLVLAFTARPCAAFALRTTTGLPRLGPALALQLRPTPGPRFSVARASQRPARGLGVSGPSLDASLIPPFESPVVLSPQERFFPRWFEFCGMSLGAAGIVGGSILLAIDEKHVPLFKEKKTSEKYYNRHQGTAVLVAGIQTLVASTIFFVLDDWLEGRFDLWRQRRRARSAGLSSSRARVARP